MRVIKFRGRRIDNGEWTFGDLIHHSGNGISIGIGINSDVCAGSKVDPETVGQFTGFIDAEDQELYEGDIVIAVEDPGEKEFRVEFDLDSGGWILVPQFGGLAEALTADISQDFFAIWKNPK